jgi:hypothetical protein
LSPVFKRLYGHRVKKKPASVLLRDQALFKTGRIAVQLGAICEALLTLGAGAVFTFRAELRTDIGCIARGGQALCHALAHLVVGALARPRVQLQEDGL